MNGHPSFPASPTRRHFLQGSASMLALPLVPTFGPRHRAARARFFADPFTLGVASGDASTDGVVLWTRLAPRLLDADGGMPAEAVEVAWEVASDDAMRTVVARGTSTALPELAHSVHVELDQLQPDRWYWYRFRAGDAQSAIGRTRTLPAAGATPERLRFAVASCQHFEHGYFTPYLQMAKQELDLVLHTGDYIYEYAGKDGLPRKHVGEKLETLADYRVRHALYRSDPMLQAMHARCPWFVTWDDHELENNYANDVSERKDAVRAEFLQQRANAYRAYYEAMPLRAASLPKGPDMQLYRRASFGKLAELFVLDTRQYRTDQPNGDGKKALNDAARDPRNTQLGKQQREWLQQGLARSSATWNVLAQQVMMGLVSFPPRPPRPAGENGQPADAAAPQPSERRYSMDQWPGYLHERTELLQFLAARKVANPVVLTGDIHSGWVNDLRVDDRDEKAAIVATEFVGTSISSDGDGRDAAAEFAELQPHNPGLRFLDRHRGFIACTVTKQEWRSDYVIVDRVTVPDAKASTVASFTVAAGKPGAVRA